MECVVNCALSSACGSAQAKVDPVAVGRAIENLPILVACNDLRALTELEQGNKSLFQEMGGVIKLVDYLYPHG